MHFQLREDAKTWFKHIYDSMEVDFDIYYLCLMAGLAARRKLEGEGMKAPDLVENFPIMYRPQSRLLVGLLLHAELVGLGVDLSNREDVGKAIADLISPDSPSLLSDKGVRTMNQYSNAGYAVLEEALGDPPRSIETFLRKYQSVIKELRFAS